ncbi:MAG: tetratricopeptide repeat protein [Boseongicola sp. SB0662_bin_57]|nr:tetratricopeptide repeat protein [Boseongicola sp. SB0662_bin_57]
MRLIRPYLKCPVAAVAACLALLFPAFADDAELDALFESLQKASPDAVQQIERQIYRIWSQSGSPAMDLLLERGRKAHAEGNVRLAIEHFSALVDHAPDFAEGYNARATAYFQTGRFGQSLADIQRTLRLNPRHFGAISGLAAILEQIGRPEDALEALRAVEELSPHREGLSDAISRLEREVEGEAI